MHIWSSFKYSLTSCDKFRCGLVQTMSHTVHECPETTMLPDGGPQTLHFSDNDTVYCLERTSMKVITTRIESFCAVLWHACVSPEQRPCNIISPYLWFIFLWPRTIQTDDTFPHRTAGAGWSSEDTGGNNIPHPTFVHRPSRGKLRSPSTTLRSPNKAPLQPF